MQNPAKATNSITVGQSSFDSQPVTLDLYKFLETRALVQASSGGGKSWLVRVIAEQVLHQNIPVWLIDPEGEYVSLREKFDLVIFASDDGDLDLKPETLTATLPALLKKQISCVFDLSDLNLEEKRERVVQICNAILSVPKSDWNSMLLCVDEAQILAPEGEATASMKAIADIASRGRKRGVGLTVATQRLSALDKNVTSQLLNRFVGWCLEDIEVARAAKYIGKDNGREVTLLEPGDFFAIGPALNFRTAIRFHASGVETTHPEASTRRELSTPKATTKLEHLVKELRDSIVKKSEPEKDSLKGEVKSEKLIAESRELQNRAKALDLREQGIIEREKRLETLDREIYSRMEKVFAEANQLIEASLDKVKTDLAKVFRLPEDLLAKTRNYNVAPSELYKAESTPGILVPANKMFKGHLSLSLINKNKDSGNNSVSELSRPQQKVLDALALCEKLGIENPKRINVAFFAGYTENGHFNNIVGGLNQAGLLHYPSGGCLALTDEGQKFAQAENNPLQTLEEFHGFWMSKLSMPEQRVLKVLLEVYPNPLAREALASYSGYTVNGHFNNVVGHLATLGIANYPQKGYVAATGVMFPDGLE